MWRLLAAAALIGICSLLPASPAVADQAKGTLTINTESADVWFSVNVKGSSAPAATKLADAAGEHVADVAATMGTCPASRHAKLREIGLTGSIWCVHVSHLQVGYAVSGTLASDATSLSLTVRRKDGPGFPLLWSVTALVAAAAISFLSSTYVPGLTSRLRRRVYERDGPIAGLGNWVKMAAANGILADDDIVARAQWARKHGRRQVMKTREKLGEALAVSGLAVPDSSPLWKACQAESAQTDITREDVLTDDGGRSDKAANLLESLTKANTAIHDFTSAANELIDVLTDPDRSRDLTDPDRKRQATNATNARDNALKLADSLTEERVPRFIEQLDGIIQSKAFQAPGLEARTLGPQAAAAISGAAVRVTVAEIATSMKAAFAPAAVYIPAVLLAFVIMAGAVATVFSAQYLANPNFGTLTDYWTLILSAYGSAQATAIAAALLLMRSPKPWYG